MPVQNQIPILTKHYGIPGGSGSMFGSIKRICKNIIKLDEKKILRKVLSTTSLQQDILSLNTEDQLYEKGIDSKGVSLGDYADNTIQGTREYKGKIEKGQRFDHITLNDTGEFYASFKFKNTNDGFIIQADDQKDDTKLTDQFGKDIIGLTEENLAQVREWVKPLFIREVRKEIFA